MTQLTAFLTSVFALSLGVERVIEILKGAIPALASEWSDAQEPRRRALLQLFAATVGAGIATLVGPDAFMPTLAAHSSLGAALLLGVMASGGSAMWNHALDIVGAIKTTQETVTKAQVDAAKAREAEAAKALADAKAIALADANAKALAAGKPTPNVVTPQG